VQAGQEPGEQFGVDHGLALGRSPHAVDDVVQPLCLGDEPRGTGLHGGDEDPVGGRGGQHDDLRGGPDGVQAGDRRHPVAVGQAVVQEDDVGSGRLHQVPRGGDRRPLPDDEQVRLGLQGLGEAGGEHLVVVDDQDPHRSGGGPVRSSGPDHSRSLTRISG
jgi:hypothetical protein